MSVDLFVDALHYVILLVRVRCNPDMCYISEAEEVFQLLIDVLGPIICLDFIWDAEHA